MERHIEALKPYVPAKDFELSKRFYAAFGFTMSEGWGGTADFTLDCSAWRTPSRDREPAKAASLRTFLFPVGDHP